MLTRLPEWDSQLEMIVAARCIKLCFIHTYFDNVTSLRAYLAPRIAAGQIQIFKDRKIIRGRAFASMG